MAQLPSESIDLVVTDPPYLIGYKSSMRDRQHKFAHEIAGDRDPDLIKNYIRECFRLLKPDTAMYMFCSDKTVDFFLEQSRQSGFNVKNTIVWVKNNHGIGDLKAAYGRQYELILYLNKGRCPLNGKRLSDVWNFKRIPSCRQLHQNQKPLDLIRQCIVKSSKRGGDFRRLYGEWHHRCRLPGDWAELYRI